MAANSAGQTVTSSDGVFTLTNAVYESVYDDTPEVSGAAYGVFHKAPVLWVADAGTTITITTGTACAGPNGSEMSAPFSGDQSYTENTSAILINGTKTDLSAITLTDAKGGAYTYFKLLDLGQSLGFGADWDAASGSIVIDTAKP